MHERNTDTEFGSRFRAIDSSSEAASDWVSRSESLVRQVKTRCFKFWGGVEDGGMVIPIMLVADLIPVAEELGSRRRSSWNFQQHHRNTGERNLLLSVVVSHIRWKVRYPIYCVLKVRYPIYCVLRFKCTKEAVQLRRDGHGPRENDVKEGNRIP